MKLADIAVDERLVYYPKQGVDDNIHHDVVVLDVKKRVWVQYVHSLDTKKWVDAKQLFAQQGLPHV